MRHYVAVYHRADGNWYETQDLTVNEVLPQQVVLTECYLQIYELQPETKTVGAAGAAVGGGASGSGVKEAMDTA